MASERDAALAQADQAHAALEEGSRRLRDAERQEVCGCRRCAAYGRPGDGWGLPGWDLCAAAVSECSRSKGGALPTTCALAWPPAAHPHQAYNARRAAELDGLQAEAEATLQHLQEQQRALGGREREAGARDKQLAAREKEVEGREALLQEQQAEVGQAEEAAAALRAQLLAQQAEAERGRAAVAQQRAALEAEVAAVQRGSAAAAQERSLLRDLREQRMAEQAAIISQLAEERGAAAAQQAAAERAVDAARQSELAAAKLLADLQAQVRWGLGWGALVGLACIVICTKA